MTPYRQKAEYIHSIRTFFQQQDFVEIFPPALVENPGMETHVHPFQVYSLKENKVKPLYLHTSPEFYLKEVLTTKQEPKIFSLGMVFRDDPFSPIHRSNFLMLEWYRAQERYEVLMKDLEVLIVHLLHEAEKKKWPINVAISGIRFERRSVDSLFREFAGFSILDFLGKETELKRKIQLDLPAISINDGKWAWDDLFFMIFLNLIEPEFSKIPFLIVDEYPAPMAALSTISQRDSRVSERFELYIAGIEIANCYNELVDFAEQENRFYRENEQKKNIYNYQLPYPGRFLSALKQGLPASTGGAIGIERLAQALNNFSFYC